MSLVKCKKCKKEISNTVKFCPHCGESTVKQFCKECGHEMAINATSCPSCGFIVNESAFYNQPQVYANNVVDESQGEKHDIALIGLIMSFIVPIVGLIMGIIALNANKGKKNSARTMGLIATIVSATYMILVVLILVFYFIMIFALIEAGY